MAVYSKTPRYTYESILYGEDRGRAVNLYNLQRRKGCRSHRFYLVLKVRLKSLCVAVEEGIKKNFLGLTIGLQSGDFSYPSLNIISLCLCPLFKIFCILAVILKNKNKTHGTFNTVQALSLYTFGRISIL